MGMPSILQDGTTPAGQVARLLFFGQFQGLLEGLLEVGLNGFALDPSTQKSAQRNSLNGVVSLANPPARRSSPANERNGSSTRSATLFGMSLYCRRSPLLSNGCIQERLSITLQNAS